MPTKDAFYYPYDKMTPSPPQRHNLLRHHRVPAARRASAADVTYLLDPSYSGASRSNTPPSIYRDEQGNLHDPDFRMFPEMPHKRRRISQVGWRSNHEDEAEREREEEELAAEQEERIRRSTSGTSTPRRQISRASLFPSIPSAPPASRRRTNTVPVPAPGPPLAHRRVPIPLARAPTWESASPSHRSPVDARSIVSEDEDEEAEYSSRSRCRMPWSPAPPPGTKEKAQPGDQDITPSCSESIRREWHAISFRIRLAIFRMYRRIRRRIK